MKNSHLITPGVEQSLEHVMFHHAAPVTRHVMLENDNISASEGLRIVTHTINQDLPNPVPQYCDLHRHDFDEVNLIISTGKSLIYKICLEDETYEVPAPATVYIPKGMLHAAEVLSGTGIYIALLFHKQYSAFK